MKAEHMMKAFAMLLLLALLLTGCSSNLTPPKPPPEQKPEILIPFSDAEFTHVIDLAFESDGELAISDDSRGILLFNVYGEEEGFIAWRKPEWTGLADIVPFSMDKDLGVIASGPSIACAWETIYDDSYFPGTHSFPDCPEGNGWWTGQAHPEPGCGPTASSGLFECPPYLPQGIDLHPFDGWLFLRVEHSKVTIDPDCGLEPYEIPEHWDMTGGILAVHPAAPTQGFDPEHWEGMADYVVYHDKTDVDGIDSYNYPMARDAVQIIAWDITHPFTMLPDRDGINSRNISDFEFDAYGRLVIVLPNANAFVITEPVNPPNPIIVDRIIGGHTVDPGKRPGEFYNPSGVAISPLNGDIYITDTGNDRVQVFDKDGNFTRMFGKDIGYGTPDMTGPSAIEIDGMGNIYLAVENEPHMVILSEYGYPQSYGAVEGYVKDESNGSILEYTIVSIAMGIRTYTTVADEKGYFLLNSIPQGGHMIIARRTGYAAEYMGIWVDSGCVSEVTIEMKPVLMGGGFGEITGSVLSSLDGDPLPGLDIQINGLGIFDITAENGGFHLTNVPPGELVLQILSNYIVVYEQDILVEADVITPLGIIYLPI